MARKVAPVPASLDTHEQRVFQVEYDKIQRRRKSAYATFGASLLFPPAWVLLPITVIWAFLTMRATGRFNRRWGVKV